MQAQRCLLQQATSEPGALQDRHTLDGPARPATAAEPTTMTVGVQQPGHNGPAAGASHCQIAMQAQLHILKQRQPFAAARPSSRSPDRHNQSRSPPAAARRGIMSPASRPTTTQQPAQVHHAATPQPQAPRAMTAPRNAAGPQAPHNAQQSALPCSMPGTAATAQQSRGTDKSSRPGSSMSSIALQDRYK